MRRVHIFCEGQTEEAFVREVLEPHFWRFNISLNPILLRTSSEGRGGISSCQKVRWQIEKKCKEDKGAWVTTLLDLYGLPKDFPGGEVQLTGGEKAKNIERAMEEDIQQSKFIANILVHEFEGLLFSYPPAFGPNLLDEHIVTTLAAVRDQFKTPEVINDGPMSAPSKRILALCGSYEKVFHGALIAMDIGLDRIRQECHHFRAWIERLESL